MLTVEHLNRILDTVIANGIATLEVEGRDYRLRMVRDPAAAMPARVPVAAPLTGRFAARGGDDGLPALAVGATVAAGEILGYVCLGPVRVPVPAPSAGRIADRRAPDGGDVARGAALFTVETRP